MNESPASRFALKQSLQRLLSVGAALLAFSLFPLAALATDGANDATFTPGTGANNEVWTILQQTDGKLIIGGFFTSYNGTARNYIARLNTDGTLDGTFTPGTGANNFVLTAALQSDGKIIIGGLFTSYNGTARNRIARLNTDGTLDGTFNPGTGADGIVYGVAVQTDGKVVIGGAFTNFNGSARSHIARLTTAGALDGTFTVGTGTDNQVETVFVQADQKILIGGAFTDYNGHAVSNLVRVTSAGAYDATFVQGTGISGVVNAFAEQTDGKIIIGGGFSDYNGTSRSNIARVSSTGTLDGTFTTATGGPDGPVEWLGLQSDGKIVVVGQFLNVDGVAREGVARLKSDSSLDTTYVSNTNGTPVYGLLIQSDGKAMIGGAFTTYNGVARGDIARINYSPSIIVSGTVFTDEGATNIGAGKQVRVLVNGVFGGTGTTIAGGSYSVTVPIIPATGDVITAYIDGAAQDGVTITRFNTGSTVTNTDIYQDHLIAKYEDTGPITNANLDTGNSGVSDITNIFSDGGGANLTMASGKKLLVWTGKTYTPGGTITAAGGIRIQSGATLNAAANTITDAGELINFGTVTHTGTLTFNGTAAQYVRAGTGAIGSDIVVSNTTLPITLSGTALNIGANDLTINANATLSLNGKNLTATGTFSNNGTLRLVGAETTTLTQDIDSGTWEYVGNGNGGADTFTLKDFGATDYFNLLINAADAGDIFQSAAAKSIAGTLTVSNGTLTANTQTSTVTGLATVSGGTYTTSTATQTLNGGLTISGGTLTGSTGTIDVNGDFLESSGTVTAPSLITVSGNFTHSGGTFTHNAGTITFDGCNQSISGTTTFFNFVNTDVTNNATSCTLTIASATTQTIAGSLTLDGLDSDDLIKIRSSTPGTAALFNVTGSFGTVDFVDVEDNTLQVSGVTDSPALNPTGGINSGNTLGWFPPTPVITNVTSSTVNGYYKAGAVISVQVTFDQAVTVTGTPQLTLELGATDITINYASGSTTTTLNFTYIVAAPDTSADLDYVGTTSLTLNGGTIQNAGLVNATLTLPAPAAAGSLGANKNLVIDTTPPAPGIPDMTSATDTGTSNTDNLTNVSVPDFTGNCESGLTVTLIVDGSATAATGACAAGTFSITAVALADGTHTVAAEQTDLAGNIGTSGTLSVTIDTSEAAPGIPDLQAASDTGTSATDNITSDTTPTFDISCVTGDTITLSGATLTATGTCVAGTVSITLPAIAVNGVYSFKAFATDPAGNTSPQSASLSVTIDTIAPPAPVVLTPGSGSTIATATTVLTGTGEVGATVTVKEGATTLCTAVVTGAGTWTCTSSSLTNSLHTISVTQTDIAGNVSPARVFSLTVSVPVPVTPTETSSVSGGGGGGDAGGHRGARTTTELRPKVNALTHQDILAQAVLAPTSYRGKCIDHLRDIVLPSTDALQFDDVPKTAWFWSIVDKAVRSGMATGVKDKQGHLLHRFEPDRPVMVAEAVRMLLGTADDLPITVVGDLWYQPLMQQGADTGLLSALRAEDLIFSHALTREQAIPMFLAATCIDNVQVPINSAAFTDVTAATPYAQRIWLASSLGIVTGYGDGTFKPNQPVNRAEMVAMIVRAVQVRQELLAAKGADASALKPQETSSSQYSAVPLKDAHLRPFSRTVQPL